MNNSIPSTVSTTGRIPTPVKSGWLAHATSGNQQYIVLELDGELHTLTLRRAARLAKNLAKMVAEQKLAADLAEVASIDMGTIG